MFDSDISTATYAIAAIYVLGYSTILRVTFNLGIHHPNLVTIPSLVDSVTASKCVRDPEIPYLRYAVFSRLTEESPQLLM